MKFYFDIGGFDGMTTEVMLRRNYLHIYQHHGKRKQNQNPLRVKVNDNDNWNSLINFLNSCGWKPEYHDDIYDGTQWSLRATTGEVKLCCNGSNAYPADFDTFLYLLSRTTSVVNVFLI